MQQRWSSGQVQLFASVTGTKPTGHTVPVESGE